MGACNRVALACWSLVFILLGIGCVKHPSAPIGQHNAIWSESIYLRGYNPRTGESLTDARIEQYGATLKRHRIKYAYLFAGPYGEDGHLPAYAFSDTAVRSVQLLRERFPEIEVLPWVGGVQDKTVHLDDSAWVENALRDTRRLVERLGVSGIHVDLEYINPGEPFLDSTIRVRKPDGSAVYGNNVNAFHQKLRALLPTTFISSVVLATSPDTKPWKRKTSMEELRELVMHVDQLAFLYYDTSLSDQQTFEDNCKYLLEDMKTLRRHRDIQYLIAIGTFTNPPALRKYRDQTIESIPNTLRTIRAQASRIAPTEQLVDGIAIWSEWEIEPREWRQFNRHWGTS